MSCWCSCFRSLYRSGKGPRPGNPISRSRWDACRIFTPSPKGVLASVVLCHPSRVWRPLSRSTRIETGRRRTCTMGRRSNRWRSEARCIGNASYRWWRGGRSRHRRWLIRERRVLVILRRELRRRWSICSHATPSPSSYNLIILFLLKACELWHLSSRILSIDLDQTGEKELLFLVGSSLPIV